MDYNSYAAITPEMMNIIFLWDTLQVSKVYNFVDSFVPKKSKCTDKISDGSLYIITVSILQYSFKHRNIIQINAFSSYCKIFDLVWKTNSNVVKNLDSIHLTGLNLIFCKNLN